MKEEPQQSDHKQTPTSSTEQQLASGSASNTSSQFSMSDSLSDSIQRRLLTNIVYTVLATLLVFILMIPLIYMLGNKRHHIHNVNMLHDTFEESPEHQQLYSEITKEKYAVVWGSREGGLFEFMEHVANREALKERNVIVQDFHTLMAMFSSWMEECKYYLEEWLDLEHKFKNIWILVSKTGQSIPKHSILKIIHRYPGDKIFIFITRKVKLPHFALYQYPSITEHGVKESIEKNFKMDEHTADILYDFFGTPQEALIALDIGDYSQQQLLGDYYCEWNEDFTQKDIRIIRSICKYGESESNEGVSEELQEYGIIHWEGQNYWVHRMYMLNHELNKKIRCKEEGVVPDEVLFQIEENLAADDDIYIDEDVELEEEVWNEDQIPKPKGKGKKGKEKKQRKKSSKKKESSGGK